MAYDGLAEARQIEDNNGAPVSGARIHFYKRDTLTYQTVYTDPELTTPAANPVIADSNGYFVAYMNPLLAYDVVIKSADDATTYASYTRADQSSSGDLDDDYIILDTLSELQNLSGYSVNDVVKMNGRTAIGDGGGGEFKRSDSDLSASVVDATLAIASGDINTSTEVLTETSHGRFTGEACIVDGGDGLTANTVIYYLNRIDNDTLYLYDTLANALAGTSTGRQNLTGTTAFNIKILRDPLQGVYVINADQALDGSNGAWVRQEVNHACPEWFGAVGDDSTDDTAAFQAGLHYLGYIDGGTLKLGLNTYYCAETITARENGVRIEGLGMEVSKFRTGQGADDGIRFARNEDGRTYFRYGGVSDMSVEYTGSNPTAGALLRCERAREFRIVNVRTEGGYNGIVLTSPGVDCIVENSHVLYQNFTGSEPGGTSAGIVITRQQTTSADANAVQDSSDSLYYATGYSVKLNNVEVWGSGDYGWEYGVLVNHIDGLQINHCHLGRCEQAQLCFKALQTNLLLQNVSVSNTEFDPAPEVTNTGNMGVEYESDGLGSRLVRTHKYGNCSILGADANGFRINEDVDDIIWTGGAIKNCDDWSVRINNGTNIKFDGLQSNDPDQASVGAGHVIIAGGDQVNLLGLQGHGSGLTAGVSVTGGTNVTVDGCTVIGSSDPFAYAENTILGANDNRSDRSRSIASAASLSCHPEHDMFYVTGTTTIEGIDKVDTWEGREITLIFDASLTVTNNTNPTGGWKFRLTGNKSATARDTLTVVNYNNIWYEKSWVAVA